MNLVQIILLLFVRECISSETASFYGGSYISVPLEEAKSTTSIHFRLLTKNPEAILFLAAGKTDYCLIKLVSGRLRVHINLGAGESTISSPLGLRLDDLAWHQISFLREDAFVNLTIDNIHTTRYKLPGRFFELNIHYGLYMGGQGEFSELFLGHVDWFRGCLSDLIYNGVFPLNRARHRLGLSQAYDVSWNCASEFYADSSTEISFVDDGSFMSLPNSLSRVGTRWEFEVKTVSPDCLLMYTTGGGENADFVGAEIIGGKMHVILDKGGGPGEVHCDTYISDGKWHSVIVDFSSYSVQVVVDGKSLLQTLTLTATRFFDLGDVVFVGGIELNKRGRALGQGLRAADTSLKGCIRAVRIGSDQVGFPHAKVTKGVLSKCVWSYPCNYEPCENGAVCVHRGVNSFLCLCDKSYCIRQDFPNSYTVYSKTLQLELIELKPLSLLEGQNLLITPSHINIILDYAKYGVRDSGILFSTIPLFPPKHGRLSIEIWEKSNSPQTFTLLDLAKDKVRYVHDGSESYEDSVYLELELSPVPGYILPGYLQGQHRFILHVNITAVNDPPFLVIPTSKSLKIPQGTRAIVSSDILNATDVDSTRSQLLYTVLFDGRGRVEKLSSPGEPLLEFLQEDVDNGVVAFFHDGPPNINTKLTLQVSDGIVSSQAASLRISVIPLVIRLTNNTGALLPHNTYTILGSESVSLLTNAQDPLLQIIFKIVEFCEYGVIERGIDLDNKISWQNVNEFSYTNLMQGVIRYKHTDGLPSKDKFKFKLSSEKIEFPTVYEYEINFIELNITQKTFNNVFLNGSTNAKLSEENVHFETVPISVSPDQIVLSLVKLATFGNLYYTNPSARRLVLKDNFTQSDINRHLIEYKMLRKAYIGLTDEVVLDVGAQHCPFKITHTVHFLYQPPHLLPHSLAISINPLKVMEGGRAPILPDQLNITVSSVRSLMYELFSVPSHGSLFLVDPIQNITLRNVTRFTPSQISAGRLFYAHDGSESTHDEIKFLAISNIEEDFLTVGSLDVEISLVNDNAPVRMVSNVFRIVTGGQRILTTKHIKFEDKDVDFDPRNLVYTVKEGSGIYSALTKKKILQFTQAELELRKVLIIEEGEDGEEGGISVVVSDGTHSVKTSLDVRPSPPFVEITNNSHLIVSQGGQATVSTSNLFADTNIDIQLAKIRYTVLSWPSHGKLLISGVGNLSNFIQEDIELGKVMYIHSSPSLAQDRIQFKVWVDDVFTLGTLAVRVFPVSYWEPLIVEANETLFVEEFTSVVIGGGYLQVKQSGVPPSDVTFLVVSGPENGYLDIEGNEEERSPDYEEKGGCKAFDQATINGGKLYYVESAANETRDTILVDVTNGVTWLRSLKIHLEIIPSTFFLENEKVSVVEGGSVVLPSSLFTTSVFYYQNKITDYYISEGPSHGNVILLPSKKQVSKWTPQQMRGSIIKYVHDGSDTVEDSFTLLAKAGRKESQPSHVVLRISPVNDMSPVIVNKTCIQIWQGGHHLLTSAFLAAVDKDTPPENITFVIISASGGYIALYHNKSHSINNFTQFQINTEQVLIVHDGGPVNFVLETVIVDGKNKYGPITFTAEIQKPTLTLWNVGLKVFPLMEKHITNRSLSGIIPDKREALFVVRRSPEGGKLLLEGSKEPVNNFSQSDINFLRLTYKHTNPFKQSWMADSFLFDVLADFTEPLNGNVFHINISVLFGGGGLEHILDISSSRLEVEEGGFVPLSVNTTGIAEVLSENVGVADPVLVGYVSCPPGHGSLCLQEDCNISSVSESQLKSGSLMYHHDHSDTTSDFVQLSLSLEPGEVLLINLTFSIKIQPINDQPFKLLTENLHMNVVRGQEVTISPEILNTEDSDTDPSGIMYEIVVAPKTGTLLFSNNTASKFSQDDINNGKIRYKHFGSLQPTFFNFKVSDGYFEPIFKTFNITVSEIEMKIVVVSPLKIQQGFNVTYLPENIFIIETNAIKETIFFNITTPPTHGTIVVKESRSLYFRFEDMFSKSVFYKQDDMRASSDFFDLLAYNILCSDITIPLRVDVSVEPLIKFGKFSPITGFKSKLDTSIMDASFLARITNSNPMYKILKRPKHGRLKKIIRTTGEHKIIKEKDVSKFTHKEVQGNVIYYVAKKTLDSVEDSFTFMLTGVGYQPAFGELKFKVVGDLPSTTFRPPKQRIPGSKVSKEQEGVEIASPNMSEDYLVGLSMVTGTIIVALMIVGLVSWGSKQPTCEGSSKSGTDLPESKGTLPRPPEDLPASTPTPTSTHNSTPHPPPPPAPREPLTSSQLELNLRYPYGDEDWNSFGTNENCNSEKKNHNPLLRKNQYWV